MTRPRMVSVTIRFDLAERKAILEIATEWGESFSDFVREACRERRIRLARLLGQGATRDDGITLDTLGLPERSRV